MNNYKFVDEYIAGMKAAGKKKSEIVQTGCEMCIGWPYVWGSYGQLDTPNNRKAYAERSSCPEAESAEIKRKCQVLNGSKSSCAGCKWYPDQNTRMFDCRGFTRWILSKVDIALNGAGATSQWNTAANWTQKGDIKDMPQDIVCCVFWRDKSNPKVMAHTGMHIGGGVIVHCSGEVKYGNASDRGWTDYAIPVGMDGEVPVPDVKPTLRKGSKGPYVVELQNDLIQLGYSVGPSGADGIYGTNTEKAVKAFQKEHGLAVDGICGKNTWAAIDQAIGPEPGPAKQFTVHIPHLTESQADALMAAYPGSWKTEE